ncbi:serine protease inhibitor swm-1 [Microplitis demolitor]|uniref:serine protease inhibitor swm-1 n=1 Tax=Microplitis demolitor TaxID=69319 RepID=UPI0004CD53BD|nr:serine protease inhibitor swm-1 [Microplitis demolitor]
MFVFIFFLLLTIITADKGCQGYKRYACGPHESVDLCGHSCEPSCDQRDFSAVICLQCTSQTEGCRCNEGYLRYKGRCILPKDCPPKPPTKPTEPTKPVHCAYREIYAACGKTCEGNCTHPYEPEICSRIRCGTQDCRCDLSKGMVRYKGHCIHKSQCPRKCC